MAHATSLLVIGLDHVGILVRDLDVALARYADITAGRAEDLGTDEELDCRWARIDLPEGPPIELVAPRSEGSVFARDLARRGEGLHHLSFRVGSLEGEQRRLTELGVELFGVNPDHAGWQEMFVHPGSSHGVLIHACIPPPP
jgi:catechol 2,3-dioxygenase-like lactoylglutathione lyase family enzyme